MAGVEETLRYTASHSSQPDKSQVCHNDLQRATIFHSGQVTALLGGPPALPVGKSPDRKSTRLNSSHVAISYAVFCLKKKKKKKKTPNTNSKKSQHYINVQQQH